MAYKVFTNGSVLQASEINDNLMRQSVMVFSNAAARTAAITSPVEGMVTYLEDTNQLFIYSGSSWIIFANSAVNAYSLVQTIYSTSSGTFTKATYPWLRAIRVRVQGGGAGGGGCSATGASEISIANGGSGGAYAESFITNIAALDAAVTVTVGAGGAGGAAGPNGGNNGGTSSFGSLVIAGGGGGGALAGAGGLPGFPQAGSIGGSTGTGEIVIPGTASFPAAQTRVEFLFATPAGSSVLGSGSVNANLSQNGVVGLGYGAGGTGAQNGQNNSARPGGNGTQGIVILELFA